MKLNARYRCLLVFVLTTLFYILTQWFIFKGFNGSDDLHYAMLAAKLLRGEYNPFEPGDIFSGRILLIASQAAVYKLAGINVISTQLGSTAVVIASCYLTVCRLLPEKDPAGTFIGCCLFYFNPLIAYLSASIGGDVYIMLAGVVVCIVLRSWIQGIKSFGGNIATGSLVAFIVAVSLLYKETGLVFLPLVCVAAFLYDRVNARILIASVIMGFACMIVLYGFIYHHYTGYAFFKIAQINNSSYPNHCSYDLLPARELIIRLTYGMYRGFIVEGFYPVVFGILVSAIEIYRKRKLSFKENMFSLLFAVLLVTALYFPFSLHGYQPLCSDARQFLFLLPLGVVVTTGFICQGAGERNAWRAFLIGSLIVLAGCVLGTGNKWQWMIYLFICCWSVLPVIIKKIPQVLASVGFCGILWVSVLEHRFFKNSNWFYNMMALSKQVSSRYYYFPDHDNMMHWQLLHRFDQNSCTFYNLDQHPFKIFNLYYQHPQAGSFHPGWFILNKAYNVCSPGLIERLDQLARSGSFTRKVFVGDMSAFYVDSAAGLLYINRLLQAEK